MDSITQVTLGAAVGEAILGKKIGGRAAAWGAVLGTVPDLDVLAGPFLDSVAELQFHRGFTHSIFFCFLASPIFGWAINRFHQQLNTGWKHWTITAFMVFVTHITIDVFTTYGTQIFYPFSDLPVTTDSVFIIDPLYTLPLMAGLLTALFLNRTSAARRVVNFLGLTVSSFYLLWGLGIKPHVNSVFESSFQHQYGQYEKMKTTPNGPTTFLWSGYIVKNDTVYHSVYSLFDDSGDLNFDSIPRRTRLISAHHNDRAAEVLLWFSRGYYSVKSEDGKLFFYDLRFGRNDFWLQDEGEYIWVNEIVFDEQGKAAAIEQTFPPFSTRSEIFHRFQKRISGK
ncbi:MAG: metal-dependent hydrolase [Balneolaceae bacterium]